jgi:hypothetical protein
MKMPVVTVRPDVDSAPDGTITADLIEGSPYTFSNSANGQYASSGVFQHVSVGKVAEIPFTFSVWLKAPVPTTVELRINDTIKNFDNDNSLVRATSQWVKYSMTYTFPSSSPSATVRLQIGTPEGKSVLAWGASLEVKTPGRLKTE